MTGFTEGGATPHAPMKINPCPTCHGTGTIESYIDINGPEVQRILEEVSERYRVPIPAIKGRSRTVRVVKARHVAARLLRETWNPPLTLKAIGLVLGGRDHATVINAIKQAGGMP